jgi:hypothetical protein
MSAKEIPLDQVPGIETVKQILESIDRDLSVIAAGDDFDKEEYLLKIAGLGRRGRVSLPYNLLRDIQSDKELSGPSYTGELRRKLTSYLHEGIEKMH